MQFLFAVPDISFPWLPPWVFFPYKNGLSIALLIQKMAGMILSGKVPFHSSLAGLKGLW